LRAKGELGERETKREVGEAFIPTNKQAAEHCLDNLVDEFENGDTEQKLRHGLGQYYKLLIGRDSY
jgi:hypothetical protein